MEVVIIPNRNGAMYIKKVLNHLCDTRPNRAVYFYDDNSEDDSVDIVLGYRSFHCLNNLRVFHSDRRRGFDATVFRLKQLAEEDGYEKFIVVNLYDIINYD